MKYFIYALIFIGVVFSVHTLVLKMSPDNSKEAGLRRETTRDASTDEKSIHATQRNNDNAVPRHE